MTKVTQLRICRGGIQAGVSAPRASVLTFTPTVVFGQLQSQTPPSEISWAHSVGGPPHFTMGDLPVLSCYWYLISS